MSVRDCSGYPLSVQIKIAAESPPEGTHYSVQEICWLLHLASQIRKRKEKIARLGLKEWKFIKYIKSADKQTH